MQAISCEALPKGVTTYIGNELAFIYVKRAKAKNSVISYLGVLRVRNDQCNQFEVCLYPRQEPQKGCQTVSRLPPLHTFY